MTPGISRRNALTGAALVGVAGPTLAACSSNTPSTKTSPSAAPGGGPLATTADIPEGSGTIFADSGAVVTQPSAGAFKAFTNICTHQGCPVADVTDTINCNCHGSRFSITDGSNVAGPNGGAANLQPLAEVAITVTGDKITLA